MSGLPGAMGGAGGAFGQGTAGAGAFANAMKMLGQVLADTASHLTAQTGLLTQLSARFKDLTDVVLNYGKEITEAGKKTVEAAEKSASSLTKWAGAVTALRSASLVAAVGITGMALAGSHMGVTGQLLAFQTERLSLALGGLLRPEMLRLAESIEKVTLWLGSLTEAQRTTLAGAVEGMGVFLGVSRVFGTLAGGLAGFATAAGGLMPVLDMLTEAIQSIDTELLDTIVQWGATALAFTAIVKVAILVIEAIKGITVAVQALNAAKAIGLALSGNWVQLAAAAGVAALAIGGAAIAYDKVGEAQKKAKEKGGPGRGMEAPKVTGVEGLDAIYLRIAAASRFVGSGQQTEGQKQIALAQEIAENTKRTANSLANAPPLVAK